MYVYTNLFYLIFKGAENLGLVHFGSSNYVSFLRSIKWQYNKHTY